MKRYSILLIFLIYGCSSYSKKERYRIPAGSSSNIRCAEAISDLLELSNRHPKGLIELDDFKQVITSLNMDRTVEIGSATLPICEGCIQVDRYRSSFDMDKVKANSYLRQRKEGSLLPKRLRMATGGWLTDEERLKRLERLTGASAEDLLKPFAVNGPKGVLADANNLPFPNSSMDLILTKNFPWFGPDASFWGYSGAKNYYRSFLNEYDRVLSSKGAIIILASGNTPPKKVMSFHIRELRKLGYTVDIEIRSNNFSGIIVTKKDVERSFLEKLLDKIESYWERIN